jgi:hypothetical protein
MNEPQFLDHHLPELVSVGQQRRRHPASLDLKNFLARSAINAPGFSLDRNGSSFSYRQSVP